MHSNAKEIKIQPARLKQSCFQNITFQISSGLAQMEFQQHISLPPRHSSFITVAPPLPEFNARKLCKCSLSHAYKEICLCILKCYVCAYRTDFVSRKSSVGFGRRRAGCCFVGCALWHSDAAGELQSYACVCMCEGKQIKVNPEVRIPTFNGPYQTFNLVLTKMRA